jgi:hypothetical protein
MYDAGKTIAEVRAAAPEIADRLKKIPGAGRFVPGSLLVPVQKIYGELGGSTVSTEPSSAPRNDAPRRSDADPKK